MAKPKEGTTIWVDHWLITYAVKREPKKKQICEEWINYCLTTKTQVGVIRNWGATPVVKNLTTGYHITKQEKLTYNVGDNDYWQNLSLWQNQSPKTIKKYKMYWNTAVHERKLAADRLRNPEQD